AGNDRIDGLEPNLCPQVREHCLEIASPALLPCELQVALEFAVQETFQHVAGDLRGHDPASGDDAVPASFGSRVHGIGIGPQLHASAGPLLYPALRSRPGALTSKKILARLRAARASLARIFLLPLISLPLHGRLAKQPSRPILPAARH